jgi:hypothetical protein
MELNPSSKPSGRSVPQAEAPRPLEPWWKRISGTFANDSLYREAMDLGKQYRETDRRQAGVNRRLDGVMAKAPQPLTDI